jgi:hypothetical protein
MSTNQKSNTVGIAKGNTRKPAAKRKPAAAKKPVAKKLTPEQERDRKAKEKVAELLKDSPLSETKEELLELEEEPKGTEWLQEQLPLLTQQIEGLKTELKTEKEMNTVLTQKLEASGGGDGEVTKGVHMLFDELQANYVNMGKNQQTGAPNLIIAPTAFLNRLIQLFPFLAKKKKF